MKFFILFSAFISIQLSMDIDATTIRLLNPSEVTISPTIFRSSKGIFEIEVLSVLSSNNNQLRHDINNHSLVNAKALREIYKNYQDSYVQKKIIRVNSFEDFFKSHENRFIIKSDKYRSLDDNKLNKIVKEIDERCLVDIYEARIKKVLKGSRKKGGVVTIASYSYNFPIFKKQRQLIVLAEDSQNEDISLIIDTPPLECILLMNQDQIEVLDERIKKNKVLFNLQIPERRYEIFYNQNIMKDSFRVITCHDLNFIYTDKIGEKKKIQYKLNDTEISCIEISGEYIELEKYIKNET